MKKILKALALSLLLAAPLASFAAGAIAVDDEVGDAEPGYGLVTGEGSRESASSAALAMCRRSGNANCKVVARFDTCGAYASSKKFYGAGWGASEAAARSMAMERCGNDACQVHVAECE